MSSSKKDKLANHFEQKKSSKKTTNEYISPSFFPLKCVLLLRPLNAVSIIFIQFYNVPERDLKHYAKRKAYLLQEHAATIQKTVGVFF